MNTEKQKLRQSLRSLRQKMTAQEAVDKSMSITSRILEAVDWPAIKRMHIYSPILAWNEVDTGPLKSWLQEAWPNIMITTPLPDKNQPFPTEMFDLIIVPVLGFDKDKYRLGYGGGWYDRFLAGQKQAQTIGLAYSSVKIDALPHEPHDIPLQQIVTEIGIID